MHLLQNLESFFGTFICILLIHGNTGKTYAIQIIAFRVAQNSLLYVFIFSSYQKLNSGKIVLRSIIPALSQHSPVMKELVCPNIYLS